MTRPIPAYSLMCEFAACRPSATTSTANSYLPRVAMDSQGRFVVSNDTDSGFEVTEVASNNAVVATFGPIADLLLDLSKEF